MIDNLLLYISDTLNPYINLAKEKFLFDSVDNKTLILYLWQNQNTVVIGKNQNAYLECRTELLKQDGVTLARRLSGGGAVFHDIGNLNFTFICATENFDVSNHVKVIQNACRKANIETQISGRNDILANDKKFSGNAFYNSQGHSYHHGTILINADTEKLNRYLTPPKAKLVAKGIKSVKSRVINLSELSPTLTCENMKTYLLSAFEETYGIKPQNFGEIDMEKVTPIADYYGSWEHLYGTMLPFNATCEDQLSFGNVQIQLNVEKSVITSIKVYTDSLDTEIASKVETALSQQPFTLSGIQMALNNTLDTQKSTELTSLFEQQLFR